MAYMLMLVEPVGQRKERGTAAGQVVYDRMLGFAASLQQRGLLRGVESLASLDQGARLQVRDGRTRVLDGPFAEAKEMVGGFFLVDVATLDEALALAAECPAAEWCTVEVRKVGPCWA
ncbi:MAG: YciI family protein [Caldimonas sp.]